MKGPCPQVLTVGRQSKGHTLNPFTIRPHSACRTHQWMNTGPADGDYAEQTPWPGVLSGVRARASQREQNLSASPRDLHLKGQGLKGVLS